MYQPLTRFATGVLLLIATPMAWASCNAGQVISKNGAALPTASVAAGQATTIESALRTVAPQGWSVSNPDKVARTVSWQGGRSWADTLEGLALQANACITVDAAQKQLTVRNASAPVVDDSLLLAKEDAPRPDAKASSAVPPAPAAKPVATVAPLPAPTPVLAKPNNTPAPAAKSAPRTADTTASMPDVGTPRPVKVQQDEAPIATLPGDLLAAVNTAEGAYELRAGETLRRALTRWCKDANWVLVWKSDIDYQIDAPVAFPRGTSLQEATRLTMKAFWARTQSLTATVYKNQVLVIAGRNAP